MGIFEEVVRGKRDGYLRRMNEAAAQAIIEARLKDYYDECDFETCETICNKCSASKSVGSQIVTSATLEPPLSTEPDRIDCMWDECDMMALEVIEWARLECPRFLSEFFWRVDEDTLVELLEL